jgi:hypothetical protein
VHNAVQCTYSIRRVSAGPGVEGALRVNDTSNLVGGGGGVRGAPGREQHGLAPCSPRLGHRVRRDIRFEVNISEYLFASFASKRISEFYMRNEYKRNRICLS